MKIGIDLGGTNIRVGAVENGIIVESNTMRTPQTDNQQVVIDALVEAIKQVAGTNKIEGIGIGVPSVVDWQKGIVYNVMNIPSWREVHIKDILESIFNVPVAVNNDANCFALGEKMFGDASCYDDVVGLTLGTGVGSGLIINGKLYSGRNTAAGEVGSLPYLDSDYEHYCSSGFFVEHGTTGHQASIDACNNNPQALALWQEFGTHIGALIKAVLLAYDPQAIVLGGSIAKAYDLFKEPMYASLQDFLYPTMVQKLAIMTSRTPNVAIFGASALV
ncbi:MAG: ROK family protein [Muribaculaceae bacterium]